MDTSFAAQIASGRCQDPFAFLGPHADGDAWTVRAWLPQAQRAEIVIDGVATKMKEGSVKGLFAAKLTDQPFAYNFRTTLYSGDVQQLDDAYRFPPLLTAFDLYLHGEGTHQESYRKLGAHEVMCEGVSGVRFAVWAPNAEAVSVLGDFDGWDRTRHPMRARDGGVWEIFLPGIAAGAHYKYSILAKDGEAHEKCDPYAFFAEVPPKTASIVWPLTNYTWDDAAFMEARAHADPLRKPMSVYEVHLESWLRGPFNEWLTYRELAEKLVPYAVHMGFTHLELLPVMEHPFSGSWGYQVTGYYAPTSRFGTPDDFRYFVDRCHQAGLGVLLDWVPAHFPRDGHALGKFDGSAIYEHADPRQGEHRDWGTLIFNYGRNEVRTFLLSNALYWLKEFHLDGLRVDAVASMLYLDYSREEGDWIPNQYGGRENLEAIDFLRRFNELVHQVPGAISMAEESTSFAGVSRPVYAGGLGFTMKWNMGWMHDMLDYFAREPVHRRFHQQNITFSLLYAYSENFLLPVSHDEVVHGKGSLLGKMPGDEWQRFANARAFLAFMFGHPGRKLLFMGCELGQYEEWNHQHGLPWELLNFAPHRTLQAMVRDLNHLYAASPALYEVEDSYSGFEWIDFKDAASSIIIFLRFARDRQDFQVWCCNFTPVPRSKYRIGVPVAGEYREIFNSDAAKYGGSNMGNGGRADAVSIASHGRPASLELTLPPLGVIVLQPSTGTKVEL